MSAVTESQRERIDASNAARSRYHVELMGLHTATTLFLESPSSDVYLDLLKKRVARCDELWHAYLEISRSF